VSTETIAGGRYRVQRSLGNGAMANVVLAHDEELGRLVAIKLLDEQLASAGDFRARFTREGRLAAGLSHPNIVTVFDAGEAEGRPYIVMEYVDGATLEKRLRDQGALDPDEVRTIAQEVAAGLEHAHSHGLVHRDLKPGNLIQRTDGTVKIADFGIARGSHGTELTEAGTILGTAAYLAPEQAEGGRVTPLTDLYALGVVLHELVTGERPWRVDSLADLGGRRTEPVPELPSRVPGDLRHAIAHALEPDPDDRPKSAAEFAGLLGDREREQGEAATMVLPRARRARRTRTRAQQHPATWVALGLIAVLLVLALIGAVALATDAGGNGGANEQPPQRQQVEPIADGATPAEDARNLADWLRENAGG
jgi:eukaryotic-like serine/threonine-protein kinase